VDTILEGHKKVCSRCGLEKPLDDFWRDKKFKDGWFTYCKECGETTTPSIVAKRAARKSAHRRYTGPTQKFKCASCGVIKPVIEFAMRSDTKKPTVRSFCRLCLTTRACIKNRENHTEAQWYWWTKAISKYGLTPETWEELFESQGRRCANTGCGTTDPGKQRFHIDHDHSCCPTGVSCGKCIRGILCGNCNRTLGMAGDRPAVLKGLVEYLEKTD
jgi:hypothetical protein